MVGPPFAVSTRSAATSPGRAAPFGAVVAALMSMLIVRHATRGEEESGRAELVRAGGRRPLARRAALIVVAGAAIARGRAGRARADRLGTWRSPGRSRSARRFAGVGVVRRRRGGGGPGQPSTPGGQRAGGAVLGAAFILRAARRRRRRHAVLALADRLGQRCGPTPASAGGRSRSCIVVTALLAAAHALLDRRDVGAGLIRPRPGPPRRACASPVGLAWRSASGPDRLGRRVVPRRALDRLLAQDVDRLGRRQQRGRRDVLAQAAPGSLVDTYLAVSLLSMALIGTGFAIQAVLRMRSEETAGRLEPLLATAVARPRWAAGYVAALCRAARLILPPRPRRRHRRRLEHRRPRPRAGARRLLGRLAPAVWVLAASRSRCSGSRREPSRAWARWRLLRSSVLGPLLDCPLGWTSRRSTTCRCSRRPRPTLCRCSPDRRGRVVRRRRARGIPAAERPGVTTSSGAGDSTSVRE